MSVVRIAAFASFLAVAISAFQTFYLRIYTMDLTRLRAGFTELPYRHLPGFRRMLVEVDQRTPDGARILLWLPYQQWSRYGYGFWRAEYLLPGKTLIPLLDPYRDVPRPEQLNEADWLVCWRECPPPPGFVMKWRSDDGSLWRRAP